MSHYNENQIDELKVGYAPQEIDTENWRLIFQIFFHILVIMTLVCNYLLFVYHLFCFPCWDMFCELWWIIKKSILFRCSGDEVNCDFVDCVSQSKQCCAVGFLFPSKESLSFKHADLVKCEVSVYMQTRILLAVAKTMFRRI